MSEINIDINYDVSGGNANLKAYVEYVLVVSVENLKKATEGNGELLAEIMTLEEWYAQVND